MFNQIVLKRSGFTLVELLLVISIIGIMLAVIIPRAQRAQFEAKASMVRQNASEAGSYVVQWAQTEAHSLHDKSCLTIADFIMGTGDEEKTAILKNRATLAGHYTGNEVFDGVENFINPDFPIKNPFNQVSIFDRVNDSEKNPGEQPGLLFLASAVDYSKKTAKSAFNNLYFIFTGMNNSWYGSIDSKDLDGISRGIFVARFSCKGQLFRSNQFV